MPDTDDELPDAYKRLVAAQREPTKEELHAIAEYEKRETLRSRMRRRATKVY